jgi:hypothetical protein
MRRLPSVSAAATLDSSSVHPEAYPVLRRIVAATKTELGALIGNAAALHALTPADFVDDVHGLPTVTDIIAELEKPGRDPRPAFKTAMFPEGVDTLADLRPGMVLEGSVTNVAALSLRRHRSPSGRPGAHLGDVERLADRADQWCWRADLPGGVQLPPDQVAIYDYAHWTRSAGSRKQRTLRRHGSSWSVLELPRLAIATGLRRAVGASVDHSA